MSAGELDWSDAVPLNLVTSLKADARFTYVTSPVAGIPDFLAFNTKKPPFDNPKVRQAVALAINRADIRDVAYLGTGELGLEEDPHRLEHGTILPACIAAEPRTVATGQATADRGPVSPTASAVEYLGLTAISRNC